MTEPDDIDRLFAQLAIVLPPPAFVSGTVRSAQLAAVVMRRRRARRRFWLAVDAAALIALAALSVLAGAELQTTGVLEMFELMADLDVLMAGPTEALLALGESFPWLHAALLAANLMVIGIATRLATNSRAAIEDSPRSFAV